MKQNTYYDDAFFAKYSNMGRSGEGLDGAGEWHELMKMLPDVAGKRVLDLGCGFGRHCRYAEEQGAQSVVGIDISEKMPRRAKEQSSSKIQYICRTMEDLSFPDCSFDVVLSSLAFHYVRSFGDIAGRVSKSLSRGGDFVF